MHGSEKKGPQAHRSRDEEEVVREEEKREMMRRGEVQVVGGRAADHLRARRGRFFAGAFLTRFAVTFCRLALL